MGTDPKHFITIEAAQDSLNGIEKAAPKEFQWNRERGDPAGDILEARLRAKYYGAQVITYRHFILELLNQGVPASAAQGEKGSTQFLYNIKDVPAINKKAKSIEDVDPKVLEYAEKGIKALIFSTRAFHGLGDPVRHRLSVTNIWGTAHAYVLKD